MATTEMPDKRRPDDHLENYVETLADAHGVEVTETAAEADDGASTVSFTYTGAYEPLLEWLGGFDLLDLTIEEAPLEAVFMRFYDEGQGKGAATRRPTEAADDRGAEHAADDREPERERDGERGERPRESTDV